MDSEDYNPEYYSDVCLIAWEVRKRSNEKVFVVDIPQALKEKLPPKL